MVGFGAGLKSKYQPLDPGQVVRFLGSGRYDYDFKRGDEGVIERVISPFPRATDTIYLVRHFKSKTLMWVTGSDIIQFDQLSLEQIPLKGVVLCQASKKMGKRINYCEKDPGHKGWHRSKGGLEWFSAS